MPGSRLRRYCDLYAKYWFTQLNVVMPAGSNTGATGRFILAWFDDPNVQLETAPDALINQCLSATHCTTASWWMEAEMDYSPLVHERADRGIGYETNPSQVVQDNEPYRCFQGLLVMVADGNAAGVTALDVAVNIDYACEFWEPVTRPVALTDANADLVVDLGPAAGQPYFQLTTGTGALAPAAGLDPASLLDAQRVIADLVADAKLNYAYIWKGGVLIPHESTTLTAGFSACFMQRVGNNIFFYSTYNNLNGGTVVNPSVADAIFAFGGDNTTLDTLSFLGVPITTSLPESRSLLEQQITSHNERLIARLSGNAKRPLATGARA
jgi:hypothetical protein